MTELPKGWAEAAAGAVCDVVGGATPRTDTAAYWGGEIPWVTPDDLSKDRRKLVDGGRRSLTQMGLESCAATLVPAGTVLFTSRAPIGYVAIASRPVATNQGFKSLTPSDALTSDFLYWQLQYLTETIRGLGSGTTFAEVSKKVMATVPLRIAPIAEQERIVTAIEEAFSKLDAGEAGLRTVRQLLKRMREAILTAAVTGRLAPQDPADTPAARLLADLGAEPVPGMYEVPDSWAWTRLGSMLREPMRNGVSAVKADSSEGLPTFSITAVTTGDFSEKNIKYTAGDWNRASDLWAEAGDLFVQRSNTPELVGTARLYRGTPRAAIFPDLLIRVRAVQQLRPEWLELFMCSPGCRAFVRSQAKGLAGSMPKISQPVLDRLEVPVPPEGEQDRIVTEVERQISFVEACERAVDVGLARSAGLRRSVLKAAFEGRLVPQDPSDEPASVLLERIRAERAAQPVAKRRARQTA